MFFKKSFNAVNMCVLFLKNFPIETLFIKIYIYIINTLVLIKYLIYMN